MMPISSEMKKLYPKNWATIRDAILKRAGGQCEWCRKWNHGIYLVSADGTFCRDVVPGYWTGPTEIPEIWDINEAYEPLKPWRAITCVLTIAHLDHDPTHNDPINLRALCQKCHNRWDGPHRAREKKRRARDDDQED